METQEESKDLCVSGCLVNVHRPIGEETFRKEDVEKREKEK